MSTKKKAGPKTAAVAPNDSGALSEPQTSPAPESSVPESAGHFPVVGIGASAGGVTALEAFFSAFPRDVPTGMAFVVVQHLSPDHKSILSDLLGRCTSMRVVEVQDGMQVEPDCTYVIPPSRDMALLNGKLQLLEPSGRRGLRLPIDFLFRSLAQDQHERAICIVLSGTGSDGSVGARAVKGEGGLVIAQDPDTTEYEGMPRSVIATGQVDYVLPPADMPARLSAYVALAFADRQRATTAPVPQIDEAIRKICVVLRAQRGHDFSQYKWSTIRRRVERRMAIHQIEKSDDYLRFLQNAPAEVEALFHDLLIGVTNFFRDPDVFEALEQEIIPQLFSGKSPADTLRVWVCGCSTGEEAYSMAILIQERMEQLNQTYNVQIFATDVDRLAIERARAGVYPFSIAADVSPKRLARYFSRDDATSLFRVQKTIRELLVFSEQDAIKDPPFSRLDLISCRNMLIYMNPSLQQQLIAMFHYALNPDGVLFLGTSETIGDSTALFSQMDRKQRFYRRREAPRGIYPPLGLMIPPLLQPPGERRPRRELAEEAKSNLRTLTEQSLLAHFGPSGLLVNGHGDILHIYGRTGKFLEPAEGEAGLNVVSMAREGLRQGVVTALHKVAAHREEVRYGGLRVKTNGDHVMVNLTLLPIEKERGTPSPDLFLIILEEVPQVDSKAAKATEAEAGPLRVDVDGRFDALEHDLQAKDEYLQATLEEMETSNEELKSTNEEMQSINEELQSTNEELESSKEELQSLNEELATVNAELQMKVADLSRANNDMNNLLAGTGVGTLFIDHQLRIARFTPDAAQVINLIPGDVGRPVSHLNSNLTGYDRLSADTQDVLDTLVPREKEVQSKAGSWYLMRIRPYRTLENVIEGAVITFIDITSRKQMEDSLREGERKFAKALLASHDAVVIIDREENKITEVNESWTRTFGWDRRNSVGHHIAELGLFAHGSGWNRVIEIMKESDSTHDIDVELQTKGGDIRRAKMSIEQLEIAQRPSFLATIHELDEA